MAAQIRVWLCDPFGTKVCDLYDSANSFDGQLYDLKVKYAEKAITQLSFSLPEYVTGADGERLGNYRWNYARNESLIYYEKDGVVDVFRIKEPEDDIDGLGLDNTVTCLHRCEMLKHRNLILEIESVADTADKHLDRLISGTGWTVGTVDTFNEEDIFEGEFTASQPNTSAPVHPPDDVSFGGYAFVKHLTGHSEWDATDGWKTADLVLVSQSKNIYDSMMEIGHLNASTGEPLYVAGETAYRTLNYLEAYPFRGAALTASGENFATVVWHFFDNTYAQIGSATTGLTATVPQTASYLKCEFYANSTGTQSFTAAPQYVQIEKGTETEYEKYKVPYCLEIGSLGEYDEVVDATLTRKTGYNESTHEAYLLDESLWETETLDAKGVKLYPGGWVYLENADAGTCSATLWYLTEDEDGSPHEKQRSFSKDYGRSAYDAIMDLAELYDAKVKFDGYNKTVSLVNVIGNDSGVCYRIGKNTSGIKRKRDSNDIITRLFVSASGSNSEYVGIEDVNPLGTTFLLNFGYFRDLGLLTPEHEAAIAAYEENSKADSSEIQSTAIELFSHQDAINTLIGQVDITFGTVSSVAGKTIVFSSILPHTAFVDPETAGIVYARTGDGKWKGVEVDSYNASTKTMTLMDDAPSCGTVVWLKANGGGSLGARIIMLNAKYDSVKKLQVKYEEETNAEKKAAILLNIETIQTAIDAMLLGTDGGRSVNSMLMEIVLSILFLKQCETRLAELEESMDDALETFEVAMGELLRDGTFAKANEYVAGQELSLYGDAVDELNKLSYPKVEYDLSGVDLSGIEGYEIEKTAFGDKVYVTDERLGLTNEVAYVTEYNEEPLSLKPPTISVGNYHENTMALMAGLFGASELIERKSRVYDRASKLKPDGSLTDSGMRESIASSGVLEDISTYSIEIAASAGTMLSGSLGQTVLSAKAYSGTEDVTDKIEATRFIWTRESDDTVGDIVWNSAHMGMKSVTVGTTDVNLRADFFCEIRGVSG